MINRTKVIQILASVTFKNILASVCLMHDENQSERIFKWFCFSPSVLFNF